MIRFTSPAGASVSMFDKDAKALIRMMGHSGTIPSAIRAEDLSGALAQLEAALHSDAAKTTDAESRPSTPEGEEPPVSANVRAYPLLELMKAAIAKQKNLMWEQDHAFF
jgi:hypothetical protein